MSHETFPVSDWGRAARNKLRKTKSINDCCTSLAAKNYFAVVLSSVAEIRGLERAAKRLMRTEDTMLSPEFFLASVSIGWRPKVVAVYRECDVIGILYAGAAFQQRLRRCSATDFFGVPRRPIFPHNGSQLPFVENSRSSAFGRYLRPVSQSPGHHNAA